MNQVYPWQESLWAKVSQDRLEVRLHHALLLVAAPGSGKRHFARLLAQRLLCQQSGVYACGKCKTCQLLNVGNHPDLRWLSPSEKSRIIPVDAVRDLNEFLLLTPNLARSKVAVVESAESMNTYAANSLLKTLEEPPAGTYIILLSHRIETLLPTIRSRCRMIHLAANEQQGKPWLASQWQNEAEREQAWGLAAGAPLQALALLKEGGLAQQKAFHELLVSMLRRSFDLETSAKTMLDTGVAECVTWWQSLVNALIWLKVVNNSPTFADNNEVMTLHKAFRATNLSTMFGFYDELLDVAAMLASRVQVNQQLLVESLLLRWRGLLHSG